MIFRGPFPEVSIPEVPLTDFVLSKASELGDKPAIIDGVTGQTITYRELPELIQKVASSIADRGFKKGDVFGILSPNLPEYGIVFHAVAMLGGINTLINPLYLENEIAHQLKDAGARFLITVPQFVDKAREAMKETAVEELFVFGEAEGATSYSSLLNGSGNVPHVDINPREDLVALPYSSGTTGLPKGVMLTHYNLVANLRQMDGLCYFAENDTLICVLPLFHIYGLVVILNMGLRTGSTIVTLPRFDLEQFLQTVSKYRVTLAHLVPPVVLALSKHPIVDQYDVSSLKNIFSGAAPLDSNLTTACTERLGCCIRQGYGMTETSPVTHSSPPDKIKLGSVGVPAPNTEVKVVDLSTGEPLGPNNEGEICVRGPQVMKGYLNRPDATAATIDSEAWLHTGDIGYADDEGHFYIVDRAKELIKFKGFQVPPAEIEAVLLSHPAIADAAVIPCLDDEAGEVPKAFVVLKDEVKPDAIMDYVAERVAPYKRLRYVEFTDKIPKSPSGKILRRVLVQAERERKPN